MLATEASHLRVLIANERKDRLALLAQVVTGLGHEVIAREIDVKEDGSGRGGLSSRIPGPSYEALAGSVTL